MNSTDRKNKANRRYKVRDFLRKSLYCNFLFLLVTSVIGTMCGIYFALTMHLKQILELSAIKNNRIKSKTIAELTETGL